jgi:Sulfatase
MRGAIVLVIDRLHAGFLGAYGNSWAHTRSIDRLASESFLFDTMVAETTDLDRFYEAVWTGRHPATGEQADESISFAQQLQKADIVTSLLTDSDQIASHRLADSFGELIEVPRPDSPKTADEPDETHLADCFRELIETVGRQEGPYLVWAHLEGMNLAWDAPYEFRLAQIEDGDPEPGEFVEPPEVSLDEKFDPDILLGLTQAYAGQVTLLDLCIGALMEWLDEFDPEERPLLILQSARGLAMGEHHYVGLDDSRTFGELLNLPAIVRFPDRAFACGRTGALVTPRDWSATILDCLGVESKKSGPTGGQSGLTDGQNLMTLIRDEKETLRDRIIVCGSKGETAIRTPGWYLRRTTDGSNLFVKPDDRWEVNDVASRCAGEVDQLGDLIDEYMDAVHKSGAAELTPLTNILRNGPE